MKYLDRVKVLSSKYEKEGIKEGQVGTIIFAEIRTGTFEICFEPESYDNYEQDVFACIYVKDLELVWQANITDEDILDALPLHNLEWWCKVENGFILNLKGERKNKIQYDYDS